MDRPALRRDRHRVRLATLVVVALASSGVRAAPTQAIRPPASTVDVRAFGAARSVGADNTGPILPAADSARRAALPLRFSAGTYVFNAEHLPWAKPPVMDSGAVVVNRVSRDIVPRDDDGLVIGLQQNPLEIGFSSAAASRRITGGDLLEPPLAAPPTGPRTVDVIAHWYNDFGLEYTREGGGN